MLDPWTQSLPSTVRVFFEQGHVAVRTFFVLSGFVLTEGYSRSRWNARSLFAYGVGRFARIYPVYLVSLLVVSFFMLEFVMAPGIGAGDKLSSVVSYGLVLQGWMQGPGAGWNTPAWSLSCEFVFYLCLPTLLIWLGARSRLKLAVLAVAALMLPIFLRRTIPANWKPILHIGDFLVGIVAARIYSVLRSADSGWMRRGYWLYLPAMMGSLVVVVFPYVLPGVIDLGTALRPLNGMLVLGLALGGGALGRFLSTPASQYLGQVSYSMYILHVPLLWWFGNRGPRVFGGMSAAIYILGIIVISMACFEWVEKPSNRWIRDWGRRKLLN